MGVEYSHYLFTKEDSWLPTIDTLPRILKVLEKWNLVQNAPEFCEVVNRKRVAVEFPRDPGHGLATVLDDIEGKAAADLMGKSYYEEIEEEDRYIHSISVLVGSDFRIHPSGEEFTIEIIKPPTENGEALEPYCQEEYALNMHAEAYLCGPNATPPKLQIDFHRREFVDADFTGYWRGAIKIYCGKDLPAFADKYPQRMPNVEFVKDMEEAFGCRLGQIGSIG